MSFTLLHFTFSYYFFSRDVAVVVVNIPGVYVCNSMTKNSKEKFVLNQSKAEPILRDVPKKGLS